MKGSKKIVVVVFLVAMFGVSFHISRTYFLDLKAFQKEKNTQQQQENEVYAEENAKVVNTTVPKRIIDSEETEEEVYNRKPLYSKEVFLTFDDGPSINNTMKIIQVLKENNVKASFFIVGKKAEEYKEIVKELSKEEMCILPHSYSHNYKLVYNSLDSYREDLQNSIESIRNIIGKSPCDYIRLPGGSRTTVTSREIMKSIQKMLKDKGIRYVDWNVCASDANYDGVPAERIKKEVISQCQNKSFAVVLMHDGYYKSTTVDALPQIIKYLKEEGFTFRTFKDITRAEEQEMMKMGIMNP